MIINTFNRYVKNQISETSYISHLIYILKLLSLNIEGYKLELNHIEQELKKNNRMIREYMSARICMLEEKLLNIERLTMRNYNTNVVNDGINNKKYDSVNNMIRLLSSCSDQRKRLDKLKSSIYYSQLSINFISNLYRVINYIASSYFDLKLNDIDVIYFSELLLNYDKNY